MNTTELFLRLEFLKHNPDVIAKAEAKRRTDEEEYLKSLVGPGGSVKRLANDCLILHLQPRRRINPSDVPGGYLVQRTSLPKTSNAPPREAAAHDYRDLTIVDHWRKENWKPSTAWKQKCAELQRCARINKRDQVALIAAELAAEELGIKTPAVWAWRGDERAAEGRLGWYQPNRPDQINVTLDRSCRDIAETSAHESRHAWQFSLFSNLVREDAERDAREYAKDFVERVFSGASNGTY